MKSVVFWITLTALRSLNVFSTCEVFLEELSRAPNSYILFGLFLSILI